jgi:hypothetical protein
VTSRDPADNKKLFGLERFGFVPMGTTTGTTKPATTTATTSGTSNRSRSTCSRQSAAAPLQGSSSSASAIPTEGAAVSMKAATEHRLAEATTQEESTNPTSATTAAAAVPLPQQPLVVWDVFQGTEQVVLASRRERLAMASAERKRR